MLSVELTKFASIDHPDKGTFDDISMLIDSFFGFTMAKRRKDCTSQVSRGLSTGMDFYSVRRGEGRIESG